MKNWKTKPVIHAGDGFQNNVILVFGKPRTAMYAHIDSTGYTVRYGRELVSIGKPSVVSGIELAFVCQNGIG